MAAIFVHLTVLASAFYPVPVAQPPAAAQYYGVPVAQPPAQYYGVAPAEYYGVAPRAEVFMNTQYGDPNVAAYKKKNPKTGTSTQLKGYTVGSRAPRSAVSSGTTEQFGYGIGNLYGGARNAPKAVRPSGRTSGRATQAEASPFWGTYGPLVAIVTITVLVGFFK